MLSPGVLIDSRYRLDDRLATGGMGEVWRAHDVSLGRTVAVKILLPALLSDPAFGARFRSEARMLAALHHPGVVRVYDYGETTGPEGGPIAYLVMEYIDGEPLSHLLVEKDRLSPADTMAIVAQAGRALHAAHRSGIVHRDVKPSNLLLKPDGAVMLVDFGVARSAAATTSITSTNAIIGTAMYMAPEQASGGRISPATDIYALGAVAYHCLAGHPPFIGGSPLEIALRHVTAQPPDLPADIPPPVRDLVNRALAKDPAHRFPDAASFARAAGAVVAAPAFASTLVAGPPGADTTVALADTPLARTRPAVPPPRTSPDLPVVARPPRRGASRRGASRRAIAAAAVAALLILITVITLLVLSNQAGDKSPGGTVPAPSDSATPTRRSEPAQPGGGTPRTRHSPAPTTRSATESTGTPTESSAPPTETTTSQDVPTTPAEATTTAADATGSPPAEPDAPATTAGGGDE